MPPKQAEKGKQIRFVSGTYLGKTGWLNTAASKKGLFKRSVIVDLGDDGEKVTSVMKFSFRDAFKKVKTFEQALMKQHPDIENEMVTLCRHLSECYNLNGDAMAAYFKEELRIAVTEHLSRGGKAKFRLVQFPEDDDTKMHAV
ncbi:unnamed protein product [Cylindrotheca closterium]|uniref:Uncharacterized protein n=1 Tax=Cylindrotheca closterium TaxID=2856 RepID=A0AAD2FFJ3_9STRA|nr:unnamed protein product [Cylindrotheca closterium]